LDFLKPTICLRDSGILGGQDEAFELYFYTDVPQLP
jgi:hypothetical protein